MHQRFGLVSLELLRIVGIALEVTPAQQIPVDLTQTPRIGKEARQPHYRMPVREKERQAKLAQAMQAGHQDDDFLVVALRPPAQPVRMLFSITENGVK
jgi:hypothetical protein